MAQGTDKTRMKMDIKKKNILTAFVLTIIVACIYVFAVLKAMSP
jgi:hypothetical protein